jgi:hypothetical protein
MSTRLQVEGSIGGLIDGDGQVAVGSLVLAPLGDLTVEIHFGGLFEEVAETVFTVGLPLLEQIEGEDELPLRVGDGDQGDDGVRAVAFELEGNSAAAAGNDETVGGQIEELAGDEEQVTGIPGGSAFDLLEDLDQAGRVFAGELGGVHAVVVLMDDWRRVAS